MGSKSREEGVFKPRRKKARRAKPIIVKTVLWTAIGVIFIADPVMDTIRFIYPPPKQSQQASATESKEVQPQEVSIQGPGEIAASFVDSWMAGQSAETYSAKGFSVTEVSKKQKVSTFPWSTRRLSPERAEVLVATTVTTSKKKREMLFVKVDVQIDGHKMGVVSTPQVVPYPGVPKAPNDPGIEVETDNQEIREDVESLVDSFFRQYFHGRSNDVANLFADGKPRITLAGYDSIQYQGVEEVSVSEPERGKAEAQATAQVSINGATTIQEFEFQVIQKNKRWYIDHSSPRIPVKTEPEDKEDKEG